MTGFKSSPIKATKPQLIKSSAITKKGKREGKIFVSQMVRENLTASIILLDSHNISIQKKMMIVTRRRE